MFGFVFRMRPVPAWVVNDFPTVWLSRYFSGWCSSISHAHPFTTNLKMKKVHQIERERETLASVEWYWPMRNGWGRMNVGLTPSKYLDLMVSLWSSCLYIVLVCFAQVRKPKNRSCEPHLGGNMWQQTLKLWSQLVKTEAYFPQN